MKNCNRTIRVLHLLASNRYAGAENVVCQIISMFREETSIEMVYVSPDGPIQEKLKEKGIPFFALNSFRPKEVKRAIRELKPDVIHAHDKTATCMAALVKPKDVKLISHFHGKFEDISKCTIQAICCRWAFKKASRIFWVSESALDEFYFKKQVQDKSEILRNVLDSKMLYQLCEQDEKSYDYDIVYLGRFNYPKNPQRFVELMARIQEQIPDLKVAMIGTGDLDEEVKTLASSLHLDKNIDFLGFLDNPYKILRSAKIMVMTSRTEGTPMAMLEAMALGVPVVSTPTDGICELITQGENGYLFEDDEQLAKQCIDILRNDTLRRSLSKCNVEKFHALCDLKQYKEQIWKSYKKKVLFYINEIGYGGAERVITNLANQAIENHYAVTFVASYPVKKEYELHSVIKKIYLADSKVANFLKRNLFFVKQLRKTIRKEQPHTVVSFMAEPNFRLLIATIGLKVRKVISIRNTPIYEYPNKIFQFLAKTLYRRADKIVFQTQEAKEWFPKAIQKKGIIIWNQVDEMFYHFKNLAKQQGIVTVGRLCEQKNHKLLINAFSRIADDINENLYIYGDGGLQSELIRQIRNLHLEDRIKLMGTTKDVCDVVSSAKLFVLSSDYEGMPNALMEAMALGVACLATDCPCGGPKEIMQKDKRFLVSVKDEVALADKMKYFLQHEEKRIANAQYMKECAKSFLPQNVWSLWENLLQ